MEVRNYTSLPAELEIPACGSAITASLGATAALLNKLHRFIASKQNHAVRHLKEDMDEITASLMKLSEAEKPSSTAKRWMEQARDLSYDIHDYFDNIMCSGADADASRISGFKARSEASIERRDRYRLVDLLTFHRRLPDLHVDMIVHGRMDELAMKLDDTNNAKKLKVVPIFGPEGVGKTELAKRIYRKAGPKFQCQAFLKVSEIPDLRRIFSSMFTQITREIPSCHWDAQKLTEEITGHLRNKRYFIIVDDLWTKPVWDIISRAFPDGDGRSRVITTTQIEDVALACCSYESDNMFKMTPLNVVLQSQKLYFHGVFGFQADCSTVFKKVLHGIIRKCDGLPSASINITSLFEQWKEEMEEVVNHMYNNLPSHLKTCLLYLNMYPTDYVIWKDELVEQWLAEGFLSQVNRQDRAKIIGSYFDELVSRGMIQPVDKKYNKVLSCTVHRMVRKIIACKSKEQNFITTVDYSQSKVTLVEKVRRLSVQFAGTRRASVPACITVADVRSLGFFGFYDCLPSVEKFTLLRLLVLHIWAKQNWINQEMNSVDLTKIGELSRLIYLKIACNISVELPTKIQGLKCLETLEIDASEAKLPQDIGDINSLRTLGYVDLSSNSINDVMNLQKLVNLRDLHLTCSRLQHDDQEEKLKCLGTILEKLGNLESLTFVPTGSSLVNALGSAGASSMSVSCDVLSSITPASSHLQRLELSRHYCIFSHLPQWTKELSNLCVLKIAFAVLSPHDIVVFRGLTALTALSLYIRTTHEQKIVLDGKGFRVLTYFKFICDAPNLSFRVGAMPNVQKIVLGISLNRINYYDPSVVGIRYLSGLKEITAKVGGVGADEISTNAAESALEAAFTKHPNNLTVRVQWVDWIFHEDSGKKMRAKSGTFVVPETSSHEQTTEVNKVVSQKINVMEVASSSDVTFKQRDGIHPEIISEEGPAMGNQKGCIIYLKLEMAEIALLLVIKKIGIAVAAESVKYVGKKAGLVAELPQNMRLIQNDFELMQAFLKYNSTNGCTDRVRETWIGQARRMAYDMEDIVDQFIYVVGGHHQEGSWWGYVKKIKKKHQSLFTLDEIATGLNRINVQLTQLKGNKDWTIPIAGVSDIPAASYDSKQQLYFPRHDYSISDDELVGVDKNRDALKNSLNLEECSQLQIIAVWGMGGIGKSTLVNSFFRNHSSSFECNAWVSVSQSYKIDDIWRSMLKGIYLDRKEFDAENMSSEELQVELKKILETKRYLIILDDVWTLADLFKIKGVLADKGNGSRVIITTRIEEVASIAHHGCKIKVEPLGEKNAWHLFCRKAFPRTENHICPKNLLENGKSIVKRCAGLPLALVLIGSILGLKEQNVREWMLFDGQLISELHNNENLSHVEKILNLSYKHLPDHLKSCFLYCALFPEDYKIHRKRLIRLWVAEGFIEQSGACSLEDVAEGYLTELVRRSMLQVVERNTFNRIKCLRMHSLVRELAIFQSRRENFSTNFDDSHGVIPNDSNSRRMSVLQCKNDNDIQSSISQLRLRTFIAFSTSMASSLWFFSGSKYLAVLELSGLPIKTIPKSVGELFNLRYLGLNDTNVEVLPKSVVNLHNLETLSLEGTDCLKLPRGCDKLKRLRHIGICKMLSPLFPRFESFESMEPFEGLWSLKDLQTLFAVQASKVFVAKLANLSQLRSLSITGVRSIHCAQLCDSLSKLHLLSRLQIRASNEDEVLQLETLTLSNHLKMLNIAGRFSEGTLKSPFFSTSGDALHVISLDWSQRAENPLPCLSELSNLTEIGLLNAYTGQELNFHPEWFPNVKTIFLMDLPHVNQICIHEGALVRLEMLYIRGLVELRAIPAGLEHLKSIKKAQFIDMHDDFRSNVEAAKLKHIPIFFY